MTDTYDDQNKRSLVPLQQGVQPRKNFWDFLRENRVAVVIGLVIIIGLVWWFCIKRSEGETSGATVQPSSSQGMTGGIRLTRVRGGLH
ncbi:MAG: hypothetical protein QW303_04970 [Nitrososphaerota archaeon]